MSSKTSHSITLPLTLNQARGLPANQCPPPTWVAGEQNNVMREEREDKGNDPPKKARRGGGRAGKGAPCVAAVGCPEDALLPDPRVSHAMSG